MLLVQQPAVLCCHRGRRSEQRRRPPSGSRGLGAAAEMLEDEGAARRRELGSALVTALLQECGSSVGDSGEGSRAPVIALEGAVTIVRAMPLPPPALLELARDICGAHTPHGKRSALKRRLRAAPCLVPDIDGARADGVNIQ